MVTDWTKVTDVAMLLDEDGTILWTQKGLLTVTDETMAYPTLTYFHTPRDVIAYKK